MLLAWLILFLVLALGAAVFSVNSLFNTLRFGLPFVHTPRWAIVWLRDNLTLTDKDVVYELGCGDARILAALAKKFPRTKFIGIEIQWWPLMLAKIRTHRFANLKIIHGDIFKLNLSPATMIIGFFITNFIPKLAAKLKQSLRPGTTIISYGFNFPGWPTIKEIPQPHQSRSSKILFYRT